MPANQALAAAADRSLWKAQLRPRLKAFAGAASGKCSGCVAARPVEQRAEAHVDVIHRANSSVCVASASGERTRKETAAGSHRRWTLTRASAVRPDPLPRRQHHKSKDCPQCI